MALRTSSQSRTLDPLVTLSWPSCRYGKRAGRLSRLPTSSAGKSVIFNLPRLYHLTQTIVAGIGFLPSFPTSCMRLPSATPWRLASGSLRFVFQAMSIFDDLGLTTVSQIPVALAMWNQVSAECILLIRTYAFFNRNIYVLALLVSALAGVVAYQLYVTTSEMDRECCTLLCASTLASQPRSPSFHSQCESPRWRCAMTRADIKF